jgi:hypothetical protein
LLTVAPVTKDRPPETKNLCIVASVDAAELTALQERARLRAAARAGGADRLRGHIVCDGQVRIVKAGSRPSPYRAWTSWSTGVS